LFSIENLHSYPAVARRLAEGSIRLHAWFFKISNAELYAYNPVAGQFTPLASESGQMSFTGVGG
jgi:carbonic anhydrase